MVFCHDRHLQKGKLKLLDEFAVFKDASPNFDDSTIRKCRKVLLLIISKWLFFDHYHHDVNPRV